MRIAIPTATGKLCSHFGHCEKFLVFDIDEETKTIKSSEELDPPPHQPGLLPVWLAEKGVTNIIAGGMGHKALAIFESNKIEVVTGAPTEAPENLVNDFLKGKLSVGENVCDH